MLDFTGETSRDLTDRTGYVLIDESRWCYPLIFDKQSRVYALASALKNIKEKFESFYSLLNENFIWNIELQEKIDMFDDRIPKTH